jgi:hypothetical protein
MNLFLKRKYMEETEEVKADVRKHQAEMKAELDSETNEQNTAYHK